MRIYLITFAAGALAAFLIFAPDRWRKSAISSLLAFIGYKTYISSKENNNSDKQSERVEKKIEQEKEKQQEIKERQRKLEEEGLDEADKPDETGSVLDSIVDDSREPPESGL